MKFAVFVALTAPLVAGQTACEVDMEVFTDDKCTTEMEKPEGGDDKKGDDKKGDDKKGDGDKKEEPTFTGACEKYQLWHSSFSNLAKIDLKKPPAYTKATCDGTQITAQFFDDEKCETEQADLKNTIKWGECTTLEVLGVKKYMSFSGAYAMKAAAASVIALAASQF